MRPLDLTLKLMMLLASSDPKKKHHLSRDQWLQMAEAFARTMTNPMISWSDQKE